MDPQQKQQLLFAQLVMIFHAAALQQMGKVKNPLTDTVERDLAAAQSSIDILDMLNERTKGNLTADEERMLKDVLVELKLNYIDEVKKVQAEQPKQEGEQKNS